MKRSSSLVLLLFNAGAIGMLVFGARSESSAAVLPYLSSCIPYTPAGPVTIPVDSVQTFAPNAIPCSGLTIEISPADGTAGFYPGSGCTQTSFTTGSSGLFKVRACDTGSVTVSIKQGSTVLQTITVNVP